MEEDFSGFPKTRKEAREKNEKFYFTGSPCKYGHVVERNTATAACRACNKKYSSKWYEENYDRHIENMQRFKEKNPNARKLWYAENREHCLKYSKNWAANNRDRINKNKRRRSKEDINYKLDCFCRSMVHRCIRHTRSYKEKNTYDLLGYTYSEFKENIESKFLEGMSWDNHGSDWHVDHKTSINEFIESGCTDISVINSLDNLIPMWSNHNLQKQNKSLQDYLEECPEVFDYYGEFL